MNKRELSSSDVKKTKYQVLHIASFDDFRSIIAASSRKTYLYRFKKAGGFTTTRPRSSRTGVVTVFG